MFRTVAIGLLAASMLLGCSPSPPPFRNTVLPEVGWGKDFTLTAHTGQPYSTAGTRGKVLVVFFGYTHCPDICGPTLAKLVEVRKRLGERAERLQVLFVSVDPVHDTPAQLQKFLAGFDPTFIGLTGSAEALEAVATDHVVFFKREAKNAQRIAHTGAVFVKDARGRMRLLMKDSTPVDDMLHDLQLLLAERA